MKMNKENTICTQRLLLRPVCLSDMDEEHRLCSDPEINRYMRLMPHRTLAETQDRIGSSVRFWQSDLPARCEFAILLDDRFIGDITLYFDDDRRSAGLGWMLFPEFWGKGYATEAARALVCYARERWGVQTLHASCDAENTASSRVMEKLGMRLVSRTPGRKNRLSDRESDEVTYAMQIDTENHREGQA